MKKEDTTTAPEIKGEVIHPKAKFLAHPAACLFPMMTGDDMKEFIGRMKEKGWDKNHPIVMLDGFVLEGRNRLYAATENGIQITSRMFDPKTDGESPVEFSLRENLDRRHLSGTDRALAAKKALPLIAAEAALRQKASQFAPGEAPPKKGKGKGKGADAGADNVLVFDAGKAPADGAAAPAGEAGSTPPPEAPADGKKGKSADIVAKMFGTSATMVKLANKLEKNHPEIYKKVLDGKLTITAAEAEVKALAKAAKEAAAKDKEKEERKEALALIAENYSKEADAEFVDAIKKRKVLKDHKELVEFAATVPGEAKGWIPLLAGGWTLKDVKECLSGTPTMETTTAQLVNYAIAQAGNKKTVSFEVDGYTITVKLAAE